MYNSRQVVLNIGVQLAGRVLTLLMGLLVVSKLTRYLGVDGFGRYTTVFAFCNFLAVIADFGFFNVLVRELALPESKRQNVVSNILTLRSIFAFLVFGGGFILAWFLRYPLVVKQGIGLVGISLFLITLSMTLIGVFQIEMRMDKSVVADVIGKFITTLFIVIVVARHGSLQAVFWTYIIGNGLTLIVDWLMVRPYVLVRPSFERAYYKAIIPQAFSMGIFTILSFLYFHVDMVILSLLKSDYDVGIYGAAYKLVEIILVFPGIFSGAILPILTRTLVTDRPQFNRVVQYSFDILLVVSVPAIISVVMLARPIINFIAGKQFVAAAAVTIWGHPATAILVLQILVFALVFSFISNLFDTIVISLGKQKRLLLSALLITILNAILNALLIPHYSYVAAAFITILCEMLIIIYPTVILWQERVKLPTFHLMPKIAAGSVLLLLILSTASHWSWMLALIIGWLLYGVVLYLTGAVSSGSIKEIMKFRESA